jgi:hypothetical protein
MVVLGMLKNKKSRDDAAESKSRDRRGFGSDER